MVDRNLCLQLLLKLTATAFQFAKIFCCGNKQNNSVYTYFPYFYEGLQCIVHFIEMYNAQNLPSLPFHSWLVSGLEYTQNLLSKFVTQKFFSNFATSATNCWASLNTILATQSNIW